MAYSMCSLDLGPTQGLGLLCLEVSVELGGFWGVALMLDGLRVQDSSFWGFQDLMATAAWGRFQL